MRSGDMRSGFKLVGTYVLEARAPVRIADVERFKRYLTRRGIPVPPRTERGVAAASLWDELEAAASAAELDELRSMAAGGGELFWRDEGHNRVVNVGLNDILDKYLKGSAYTAAHYVGLTDGTPTTAAGDTQSSHAGWAEVTAYDEATRQAYTPGTVASQTVNNSASKAVFTISTNSTTIGGAFLTTSSSKGTGSGVLVSVEAATGGDVVLNDGDTLSVQITYTAADA